MSIELEINKGLLSKIDLLSRKLKKERSEVIMLALKRYVHLQEMKSIRKSLLGVAEKRGFKNENQLFQEIS